MSATSTKTLDHIVHLTPPGTVEQVSQQFRDLGFNVIAGGAHAGGLSSNALVILGDGAYLELISFTHPASHYPIGSPDRQRRDSGPWAHKDPGWIDFAFLGSSATSIAHIINTRAERDHSEIHYTLETPGGRTRTDGRVLEWVITGTEDDELRGTVPFFCGDVTPREWRVPVEPPSNAVHPSGVQGVAYVRVLTEPGSLTSVSAKLTSVVGEPPRLNAQGSEYTWTLEVPSGTSDAEKPRLILGAPKDDEEQDHLETKGPGIFEVGFSVGRDGVERESRTPYSKIAWVRSP
ncbi:glyoxalase-like domain-containing protein [Boletus edulis BED1]|uniref:Glyoxalase-like domain-containing protein n=1 Tax=Boletus edulis BED1 TaxID=1328754 RepID=A0AAD4BQG8_BOLED|nr:glyoxalase-like domain-containing protein [Boletus edulis BED1]